MPKIKLTKTAVDAATAKDRDYELRDTTIPGFLVKVTPASAGAARVLTERQSDGIAASWPPIWDRVM